MLIVIPCRDYYNVHELENQQMSIIIGGKTDGALYAVSPETPGSGDHPFCGRCGRMRSSVRAGRRKL